MKRVCVGILLSALFTLIPGCDEDETALSPDGGGDLMVLDGSVDGEAGADLALADGTDGAGDALPGEGIISDGAGSDTATDGGTSAPAFTLVAMPDTQYYSAFPGNYKYFTAQVEWIVKNLTIKSLAFVSHLGDIVDSGAFLEGQWKAADKAFKVLEGDLTKKPDGLIPYGAVPGNHDYDIVYLKGVPKAYLKWFGPDRYKGRSWFLGASPNKTSMAQLFSGGGKQYLHLALEWHPADESILWALGMMTKYPGLPTIIATHEYLGTGAPGSRKTGGDTSNGGGNNSAESLFRKLVVPYPQVFMVLCGHVSGDGQRTDKTALGQSVYQVLADYQSDPFGGNGWMQLVAFYPAAKEVTFTAFSPTFKAGTSIGTDRSKKKSSNHKFSFDLVAHRTQLSTDTVHHFRQGQTYAGGTYAGTADTHIGSGKGGVVKPGDSHATAKDVHADGNGDQEQGLIRFDSIIGAGKGQIPSKTKIKKAILTLTTEGLLSESSDGAKLYRMKVSWKESATWNGLGAPLKTGKATEALHDMDSKGKVSKKGTRSFDVTTAVQAWSDGDANNGWAVISSGTNRWSFRSSEWDSVVERPMLTVVY